MPIYKLPNRLYSLQPKKKVLFVTIIRVLSGMEKEERVIKVLNNSGSPMYIYSILFTLALVMTSK